MKTEKAAYWCSITLVCSLLVGTGAWAQPQDSADETNAATTGMQAEADDASSNAPAVTEQDDSTNQATKRGLRIGPRSHRKGSGQPLVLFGQNAVVKKGQTAEVVVVIGGSAKIEGTVKEAVVAIGGNVEISGEVGDAAVAVLGSVTVKPGAKIKGDAVAVGGSLEVSDEATVSGEKVNVGIPGLHLPQWVKDWFVQCVLKMRPLAPQVPFVWVIAGGIFLLYLLISLLFPKPVQTCVDELTRRPATTFLIGLLVKLLSPIVFIILLATGVGIFIIPFIWAALLVGAIVGKIAIAQSIGFAIGRASKGKANPLTSPLLALTIGSALIVILYMVPFLGLLTFMFLSVWGLGCAVTAAFGGMRKELPPSAPAMPIMAGAAPAAGPASATPYEASTLSSSVPPSAAASQTENGMGQGASATATMDVPPAIGAAEPQTAATPAPGPLEAFIYPRAGFFQRLAAGFLDFILIGILSGIAGFTMAFVLISLAYFSGMWAWKGTTVGGIVLGLHVARLDGKPLTFAMTLVRALAAAFGIVVFFLGFLWIAWDAEKQGWHDMIAGTVVSKLPRGTPLVCF